MPPRSRSGYFFRALVFFTFISLTFSAPTSTTSLSTSAQTTTTSDSTSRSISGVVSPFSNTHTSTSTTASPSKSTLNVITPAHLTNDRPPPTLTTTDSPHPTGPRHGEEPQNDNHRGGSIKRAVIIGVIAVASLLAVIAIISFIRCFLSYRRTPQPSRVHAYIQREQIRREMEEREREAIWRRTSVGGPPLPRYSPGPPSYESGHRRTSTSSEADSIASSPPSSPTSSTFSRDDLASRPLTHE